jgi:hypothetical protein
MLKTIKGWFMKDNSKLTKDDFDLLDKQSDETLCEWHNLLNAWGCPPELAGVEDYETCCRYWNAGQGHKTRRNGLRRVIERRVGHRAILRNWNKDRMTKEEFDLFWRAIHEGDEYAIQQWDQQEQERIRKQWERQDQISFVVTADGLEEAQ